MSSVTTEVMIFFWVFVVPIVGLIFLAVVLGHGLRLNEPAEAVGPVRRQLRQLLNPRWDATPEELAAIEKRDAERLAACRHNQIISAIYNSNTYGRGK